MFRHERFLLYGTVLLLLCLLTNILVISNITKTDTHSVAENVNNTNTQNTSANSNNTIVQNVPEKFNSTIAQNVKENPNITIVQNEPKISNNTMTQEVPENSISTFIQNFRDILYSFWGNTLQNAESIANTTTKLIKLLTDEKIYDKNLKPNYGEKAVKIHFNIYVYDIISVSDYTEDYTVNMIVNQVWYDPRLQFTPLNKVSNLLLVRDSAKLIWLPDVHIANSKTLSMQLTDDTLTSAHVKVNSIGRVFYANAFRATMNCPMDLKYFPVDQQICKLVFRSFSFFNTSMILSWSTYFKPVYVRPNISFSTFTLTSYNARKETSASGVEYLIGELRFKRIIGYYINQIYVPSFMIVVVSWIPFWLNRADHYARVGLGVTTVLTITTMVLSTNESLPKTSYIKAIDVYLAVCFLMVFLAMVEFATIGFFESSHRETKKKKPAKGKLNGKIGKLRAPKRKKRNTARIDKVSRVLFPTVFILFNLIYAGFLYYISNYIYIDDFSYKYKG